MIICICSSTKFYSQAKDIVKTLENGGITCLTPDLDFKDEQDATLTEQEKIRFTLNHMERIDKSDAAYIIDPDGYTGTSVKLEIGHAHGRGKPVYATESPSDPAVKALIKKVATPKELIESLS